jgi:hypothetical protein
VRGLIWSKILAFMYMANWGKEWTLSRWRFEAGASKPRSRCEIHCMAVIVKLTAKAEEESVTVQKVKEVCTVCGKFRRTRQTAESPVVTLCATTFDIWSFDPLWSSAAKCWVIFRYSFPVAHPVEEERPHDDSLYQSVPRINCQWAPFL